MTHQILPISEENLDLIIVSFSNQDNNTGDNTKPKKINLIDVGKQIFEKIFSKIDKDQICEQFVQILTYINEQELQKKNYEVDGKLVNLDGISLSFAKAFIIWSSKKLEKGKLQNAKKQSEHVEETSLNTILSEDDVKKLWSCVIRMRLLPAQKEINNKDSSEKEQRKKNEVFLNTQLEFYKTFKNCFKNDHNESFFKSTLTTAAINNEASNGALLFLITDEQMWSDDDLNSESIKSESIEDIVKESKSAEILEDIFVTMIMDEDLRMAHAKQYNYNKIGPKFRETTNILIENALEMDENKFTSIVNKKATRNKPLDNKMTIDVFKDKVKRFTELLHPADGNIDEGFAKRTFHNYLEEYPGKKTLHQLEDLLHTVLVQRPNLKTYFLENLSKNQAKFPDNDTWRNFIDTWSNFIPEDNSRAKISNKEEIEQKDFNKNEYLKLPKEVEIKIIETIDELRQLHEGLLNLVSEETIICGIDTEWPSLIYTTGSKSSLLQIALSKKCNTCCDDVVYLLRIDKLSETQEIKTFLEWFFSEEKIVKIGFDFNEDLKCLRGAVPGIKSLNNPAKLKCIRKMIAKKPINENITDIISKCRDPEAETIDESILKKGLNSKTSLSDMCKFFIGWPLDKSEQQSVWDRDDLRQSQKQYAALDAYAMLMLYDRLITRLGLKPEELLDTQ